jgi:hypothetical protein
MSQPHVLCRSPFARLARQEDGIALVLALVVMTVLVIAAATAAQIVTSNETNSGRERQTARAFNGGESGLDQAANWVVTNDAGSVLAPGTYNLPSPAPSAVGNNTIVLSATKTVVGTDSQWTLKSTTTSPNGKVTRVLQEKMQSKTIPGEPAAFWGYGFVMGGQPNPRPPAIGGLTAKQICEDGLGINPPTVFGGSGKLTVPAWIGGDVCTSGGEHPIGNLTAGSPITVYIRGLLYGSNGPNEIVGSSTSPGPVARFGADGGCWDKHYFGGNQPFAGCDTSGNGGATSGTKDGVFASTWGPTAQVVTPPTLSAADELALYNSASPGPMHPCGAGSTGTVPPHLFDSAGSTTADTSLGSTDFVTLLGTNAFDCRTTSGDLSWTPLAGTGCLHVTGAVFFDASLTMTGGNDNIQIDTDGTNKCTGGSYTDGASNGSIYIDGTLTMGPGSPSICSQADFDPLPGKTCTIPLTGATIPSVSFSVYNRANAVPAFPLAAPHGNSRFESSAYVRGQFSLGASGSVGGSMFASYASILGGSSFAVTNVVPDESIGSETTTTTWTVIPGSWRQCVLTGCT